MAEGSAGQPKGATADGPRLRSAASSSSGRSAGKRWPAPGRRPSAIRRWPCRALRPRRRRHEVALAEHEQRRRRDPGRRGQAAAVGVAGGEVDAEDAGGRILSSRPRRRASTAGRLDCRRASPPGRAPRANMATAAGSSAAAAASRSDAPASSPPRRSAPAPRPVAAQRRRLQGDQRTHRMADQQRLAVGKAADQRQRPTASAAIDASAGPSDPPCPGRSTAAADTRDGRTNAPATPRRYDPSRRRAERRRAVRRAHAGGRRWRRTRPVRQDRPAWLPFRRPENV